MGAVTVLVLHPPLPPDAGPLATALDRARRELAGRHVAAFLAAGAARASVVEEPHDEPFGARLRRLAGSLATPGLVVLGSGSLALARAADYAAFVTAASSEVPTALANSRFSADAVAVSAAAVLRDVPDLRADNALPRWLDEVAGIPVADLRRRPRLAFDLDSPADVVLAGGALPPAAAASLLPARLSAVQSVMADRRAELTVTGRTSASTLMALERRTACRIRALVEERGLRAASRLAQAAGEWTGPARPAASVLGMLLDREGPEALGRILGRLGDAAAVDSRVLLAHRLGADEAAWPAADGPLRVRPAPGRPRRRPLAPGADGVGRRRADPGPAGRPHPGGAGPAAPGRARPMTPAEQAIRDEIARRGPIPFADFMALALGHPGGGYYASPRARPTRSGDFLTAPELHPIFGAVLANQVAEAWERLGRPKPFTLLEYGAGAGTLGLAILGGLRDDGSRLAAGLQYAPVEINVHRLAELREGASAAGLPLVDPAVLDASPAAGVVVANEFLDALPVHLVEIRDGRAREIHVAIGCDGAFEESPGELATPAVEERLAALSAAGIDLVEGQRLEVRPAVSAWAAEVGRRLAAGLVLVIDYGSPAADLYGPRRRAGTLMTYRGHAADGAPTRRTAMSASGI